MYAYYGEYEAANHRQELLREAAVERSIPEIEVEAYNISDGKYFWHEVLALPIAFRDVLHANVSQVLVYDVLRRRTQSLILMIGSAAFGLGMLAGGWINSMSSLDVVLLFGCIMALVACIPVVSRSLFFLRRRKAKFLLHRQ